MNKIYLILHNIRSAHNVGSMFRTADGAGVSKIYLTGYTPAPIDRFGRKRDDVRKVALGAEMSVEWEQHGDVRGLVERLKSEGVEVVSLEQSAKSQDYREHKPQFPVALIAGEEVAGIEQSLLDISDVIIEIPMQGKKRSLNVSVATGIALFSLREKRSSK